MELLLERLLDARYEVSSRLVEGVYQVRLTRADSVRMILAEADSLHGAMTRAAEQAGFLS